MNKYKFEKKLNLFSIFNIFYIIFWGLRAIFFEKYNTIHTNIIIDIINVYFFFIRYIVSIYYLFKILYKPSNKFNIIVKTITDFIIFAIIIYCKMVSIYGLLLSFVVAFLEIIVSIFITIPLGIITTIMIKLSKKTVLNIFMKLVIIGVLILIFAINVGILVTDFAYLEDAISLP